MDAKFSLTGIILAGGESSRFGSPKASALFLGRPMLQWVADALTAVCSSIVVVRAKASSPPHVHSAVSIVNAEDRDAGRGPLAGIVAGMDASPPGICFVASCDAPLLQPALIRALVEALDGHDAACPRVAGHMQPLAAAYRISAVLPAFRAALESGRLRVGATVQEVDVRLLDEDELRAADPGLQSFRTANTPLELAALEQARRETELRGGLVAPLPPPPP